MKPSEILEAARQYYIDHPDRWIQHISRVGEHCCVIGATELVNPYGGSSCTDPYLRAAIRSVGTSGWGTIASWNDDRDRTVEQVIEMLGVAADLARQDGQ